MPGFQEVDEEEEEEEEEVLQGGGVVVVARVTWHLPSPGPGAGCPRQGRPHLLQVRVEGTSSSTGAMEVEEVEGEEGVEGPRAAWWLAALLLSLALLLGPRFCRRRSAGWGGGGVGWRGALGRPREKEGVKVSLPPLNGQNFLCATFAP